MNELEQLRARMRALLDERDTRAAEQTSIVNTANARGVGVADETARTAATNLQGEEQTRFEAAESRVTAIDAELATMEAREAELVAQEQRGTRAAALRGRLGNGQTRQVGGGHVTREERTYSAEKSRRAEASFFVDSYRANYLGDIDASDRLRRHSAEVRVEREGDGQQERAASTGSFGSLVVPQYLVDLAAPVLRSGRPVANSCQLLPLPESGMTITIPRGTTGAAAASQATENTALQNTDEVWADLVIPVRTVGGQQDVSRQSLERGSSGTDELVYLDLTGSYHAEVDRQVITGSGSAGQMLGMVNTAGINAATAYGAALDSAGGNFNRKLAGLLASITQQGTAIAPNMIAMSPRRWGWETSLTDSTGRPLVLPSVGAPMNVLALNAEPGEMSGTDPTSVTDFMSLASQQGLPLITDPNIPTNVGTNLEDLVLAYDRRQALLWEAGNKQPTRLRFEQTLGGQLTVKLVIYGYCAFTAARYPVAFGKAGGLDTTAGQGQVQPTF